MYTRQRRLRCPTRTPRRRQDRHRPRRSTGWAASSAYSVPAARYSSAPIQPPCLDSTASRSRQRTVSHSRAWVVWYTLGPGLMVLIRKNTDHTTGTHAVWSPTGTGSPRADQRTRRASISGFTARSVLSGSFPSRPTRPRRHWVKSPQSCGPAVVRTVAAVAWRRRDQATVTHVRTSGRHGVRRFTPCGGPSPPTQVASYGGAVTARWKPSDTTWVELQAEPPGACVGTKAQAEREAPVVHSTGVARHQLAFCASLCARHSSSYSRSQLDVGAC